MEDGKTTKAIDEDAKIVYIDADNQTKGDDGMGITSFDGTTGYANALIVYERVALIPTRSLPSL